MSNPKYKVGDVVTVDTGWDRQVLRKITISEVRANHGANGAHGFYEDQIGTDFPGVRSDREAPL